MVDTIMIREEPGPDAFPRGALARPAHVVRVVPLGLCALLAAQLGLSRGPAWYQALADENTGVYASSTTLRNRSGKGQPDKSAEVRTDRVAGAEASVGGKASWPREVAKAALFGALDLGGVNALFRHRHRGAVKVLLYHNVVPDAAHFDNALTPEEFDRQLAYLKRHYNPVSLTQEGQWEGLRDDMVNVLVTFDDGFRNNLTHALPVLAKHGIRAAFFLITECIERGEPPPFLRERIGAGAEAEHFRTLDDGDVRAMIAAGMTIGSHSLTHRDHSQMDDHEIQADAASARTQLEARFGIPVEIYAYPWGKHRPAKESELLDRYSRVFLTRHGFADPHDRIIPRNEVTTLAHLKVAASGALDGIRALLGKR